MLLYTKLAPPKVPKRRSRAGCTSCKEKKKKCDETRPQCARCAERGLDCAYEAVKPRQRKQRDSIGSLADFVHAAEYRRSYRTSDLLEHADSERYDDGYHDLSVADEDVEDISIDDIYTTDDMLLSPTSPLGFDGVWTDNHSLVPFKMRRESTASVMSIPRSKQPDLAMIAPCPAGSPRLEFCMPAFQEFSDKRNRRQLVDHFCNVLSHLIVFREESGNPFQQLVLPLSYNSGPVQNAIFALASAHLEYRGVQNDEKSIYFHNKAIQGLAQLIEVGTSVDKNHILAAIMLLVYYEVLVQRGRSSIVDGHLRGALTIMSTATDQNDATGLFLERAFRFYDVITALSLGTAPLSTAPAAGCLLPFPPMNAAPASPLHNVDTLLGMATTLWPVMHRLSSLLSLRAELENAKQTNQTSKAAVLRSEYDETSQAIEVALTQWQPCLPPKVVLTVGTSGDGEEQLASLALATPAKQANAKSSADGAGAGGSGAGAGAVGSGSPSQQELARLQSILHNAMAYRHSAFVYLYRTIYEYQPDHPLVQEHAHKALRHCVETVSHKGPMGALLWPLFVSACEARSEADRALARRAFTEIELRQGMTNIEQAWRVVAEVWARSDAKSHSSGADDDGSSSSSSEHIAKEAAVAGSAAMAACGLSAADGGMDNYLDAGQLWRKISAEMGVNIVFG
ncbi:fungal-specific transcription factor domain-containing protein [Microdochium trichocladiopsis]|uniref:Fungal-specific transcription factor domain-containing protein n=1 Tax=Microdochium trichocladiopsis TaxID=1682393 RepID=A0A9P8YDP3_9PEZI|nr:fungal-specific transcription factor domain-containing protein [Microdochium trichocladiopsis]KAH7039902.1 fungal-specific transcription factor domain-containing protein [Microdochium trichocladiopsis]